MRASHGYKKDGYKKLELWVAAVVRGSVPEKEGDRDSDKTAVANFLL